MARYGICISANGAVARLNPETRDARKEPTDMASIHKRKPTKKEQCTAYHEAGHAVAAFFLRQKIRDVTILETSDYRGRCRLRTNCRHGRSTDKVFADIKIRYAGELALKRFAPASFRQWHVSSGPFGGDRDRDIIIDLALKQTDEAGVPLLLKWLEHGAKNLVDARWEHICAVAEALLKRKTLSGDEVFEIIVPLPPGHTK
jgi:hypothetical protein